MTTKKKSLIYLLSLSLLSLLLATAPAAAKSNPKYASIVIDANTGHVLKSRNANKRLPPASMTKMMTLYMTFDAMKRGLFHKNSRIRISKHAASMVPSKLDLKPGSTIRVEDAIYSLVTKSANDVAAALAESISRTEPQFGRDMTAMARRLGMNNTVFTNASGLHDKKQYSTARDMARLSQALIHDFPREYKYFATQKFKYKGKNYRNHNGLLKSYTGLDGIKTGYVNASGFNLAASAQRGHIRLIGVVFGGRTSKSRNAHMASILDAGFIRANQVREAKLRKQKTPSLKPAAFYALAAAKPRTLNTATQYKTAGKTEQPTIRSSKSLSNLKLPDLTQKQRNADRHEDHYEDNESYTAKNAPQDWSVQIGAFSDHRKSSNALRAAARKLPEVYLRQVKPQIVTSSTVDGRIYRARFSGLSQQDAIKSCSIIKDCIVMASN